ncbi:MAG: response regulator [Parcubacteria group bacterium]|nr:response regulator [Parcubacteria group bacterium]
MSSETKKAKILLIEDEQLLADMYALKLRSEGYDLTVASDGLAGLTEAGAQAFHLILLDVILPKIDGFGVLAKLKEDAKTKNVPVILLTNLGQEGDIEKGKRLGAVDYLIKANLTPAELVKKVKEQLK